MSLINFWTLSVAQLVENMHVTSTNESTFRTTFYYYFDYHLKILHMSFRVNKVLMKNVSSINRYILFRVAILQLYLLGHQPFNLRQALIYTTCLIEVTGGPAPPQNLNIKTLLCNRHYLLIHDKDSSSLSGYKSQSPTSKTRS